MKKLVMVLIIAVALVGSCFAELVRYHVKYQSEYGNTESTWYEVETTSFRDINNIDLDRVRKAWIYNEIIDKDSDAADFAIVNKLDRQGYMHAIRGDFHDGSFCSYIKINDVWHKFSGENLSLYD